VSATKDFEKTGMKEMLKKGICSKLRKEKRR
jgi:hypothetical protein